MPRGFSLLAGLACVFAALAAGADTLDRDHALKRSQAALVGAPANHAFVSSGGRPVALADLRGKPLVVSFVYTGCFQVCPATTQYLSLAVERAEATLGRGRFNVATVGFNLPFDSPEAMRDFARRQRVERDNWLFLSPKPAGLAALLDDFGFSSVATASGFDHVLQASILDADGRLVKQVYGESFSLEALVEPLKALLAGAPVPADDFAALVEKVRLLCTVYDPVSGEYRLDYALFAEMLAGLLVIAATAVFLVRDRLSHRRG